MPKRVWRAGVFVEEASMPDVVLDSIPEESVTMIEKSVSREDAEAFAPYWGTSSEMKEAAYEWLRTLVERAECVVVLEIPYRSGSEEGMLMAISTEESCALARSNHAWVGCINEYPVIHSPHWRAMRVFWHPGRAFLNFTDLASGLLTSQYEAAPSFGEFLDVRAARMGLGIGPSTGMVADSRVMENLDSYLRQVELGQYAELVFEYAWQEMHCLQCRLRHCSPVRCAAPSASVYLLNASFDVALRQKPDIHRWYLHADWTAAGQEVAWAEWVRYQHCGALRLLCLPEVMRYRCFELDCVQLKRLCVLMKQVLWVDAGLQYLSSLRRTWRSRRQEASGAT